MAAASQKIKYQSDEVEWEEEKRNEMFSACFKPIITRETKKHFDLNVDFFMLLCFLALSPTAEKKTHKNKFSLTVDDRNTSK